MADQAMPAQFIDEGNGLNHEQDDNDIDPETSEDEEDEEECRVCRGPAEAERPLFAPCKCSGSIGLTHQDCLASWLAVTRGEGKCELCSIKFQFAPKYADCAPENLPLYEVFLGLSSRTFAKWMPLALRLATAISLWLIVAPLATSYSYHGWMNRPSSILTRWKRELILGDAISGAVIAGFIIISFLSLMSLADFLRFHWQQHGPGGALQRVRLDDDGRAEAELEPPTEDDIDDLILDIRRQRNNAHIHQVGVMDQRQPLFANNQMKQYPNRRVRWTDLAAADDLGQDINRALGAMPDDPVAQRRELQRRIQAAAALRRHVEQLNERMERINNAANVADPFQGHLARINDADDAHHQPLIVGARRAAPPQNHIADDQIARFALAADGNDDQNVDFDDVALMFAFGNNNPEEQENNILNQAPLVRFLRAQADRGGGIDHDVRRDDDGPDDLGEPIFPENDRFEPQFEPLDPVMNRDEPADMDMHVALDELLGLRGPFGALLRNLLWLLAFNVTYLGLFAFFPRALGFLFYSLVLNTAYFQKFMHHIPYYNVTNADHGEVGLVQMISVLDGESKRMSTTLQLSDLANIGLGYISIACTITFIQYAVSIHRKLWPGPQGDNTDPASRNGHDALDPPARVRIGGAFDDHLNPQVDQLPADQPGTIGEMLAMALEPTAAIVKIGVLLFLKMFLLPLVLGIWLDVATLSLFQSSWKARMVHAGRDLFSATLLHWVVGITFMLLVTVSVLQLREVLHPDLLAKVIRPQEPQPDLLGNLLNENGFVHAKRMALSFGIYAVLLAVHIWIPARLIGIMGLSSHLPFLQSRLYYILPSQLQTPLELLIFHLTMLGLLEKYKNSIGETQHIWLALICDKIDFADYLLPRSIDKFVLAGSKAIFVQEDENSTSYELIPEEDMVTGTTESSTEGNSLLQTASKTDRIVKSAARSTSLPVQQMSDVLQVDPFWYNLSRKPNDVLNLIEANMNAITSIEEDKFHPAMSRRDGQRVPVGSKAFIRLPLPTGEQDVVDRRRRRAGSDATPAIVESKSLLSSKQGQYRLKRSDGGKGDMIIEFWKEVPGDLIPRPPEGWDDLGAGGAEVQGRWAWGKEKASAIEMGVAQRKPFVGNRGNLVAAIPVLAKLFFLINISWAGITVLICLCLSVPLQVGRGVLFLLRLPAKYHHDPFAIAIGLAAICPILVHGARIVKCNEIKFASVRLWISSFRLPPRRKATTVIAAFVLWFILAPLLLGFLYDLLVFRSQTSFIGDNLFTISNGTFLLAFASGSLLLNVWAALCYVNAFTRPFWSALVNAAFDEEEIARNNARGEAVGAFEGANQGASGGDSEYLGHWQGQDGRVGRFVAVIRDVLLHWEWDRVDPDILVYDFLLPIFRTLCCSLITPVTLYGLWQLVSMDREDASGITVPYFGLVAVGLYRLSVLRILMLLTLACQFMLAFQSQLRNWFQIAHKAARDDRYLVGEVLLNYAPLLSG